MAGFRRMANATLRNTSISQIRAVDVASGRARGAANPPSDFATEHRCANDTSRSFSAATVSSNCAIKTSSPRYIRCYTCCQGLSAFSPSREIRQALLGATTPEFIGRRDFSRRSDEMISYA